MMDARDAARKAERLGAEGWRLNATLAIAARHRGDTKEAYARAEAAAGEPASRAAVGPAR